jgi:hypothetical protein
MVGHTGPTRKQRFKAALALAGMKSQEWASEQGVTPQHLNAVLNADRASDKLTEAVDSFISKNLTADVLAA